MKFYSTKNINELLIKTQNNVLKEQIFVLNNEDLSDYIDQIFQINYNELIQKINIFKIILKCYMRNHLIIL